MTFSNDKDIKKTMSDSKIQQFLDILKKSYDLDENMCNAFREAAKEVNLFDKHESDDSSASDSETQKTKYKKVSGYTLFMRKTMKELKEQGCKVNLMSTVAKLWKDADKEDWNAQAAALPLEEVKVKTKKPKKTKKVKKQGPKKLSGYQVYVKETMPKMKELGIDHKERMAAIGAQWKGLSDDDKIEWKNKASELNAEAQKQWDAEGHDN